MSLRAKVEAVIYAAEEPVTLAQLAAIFAAEMQTADHAQVSLLALTTAASEKHAGVESLVEEGFIQASNFLALDNDMAEIALLAGAEELAHAERGSPNAEVDPAATEAQSKRDARQRDREVHERLKTIVDELMEQYASSDRGVEIREVAGGYRISTKPEYHDAVRAFVKSLKPPMKLSLQALETLAVIAYKQPITAPEVSEIRGVDAGGTLGSLVSRKLITTAGRKQVIGRPILYKTTREFLLRFGLKDLNELPSIEEFEKLAGDIEIAEEDTVTAQSAAQEARLPFAGEDEADLKSVEVNTGEARLAVEPAPASDAGAAPGPGRTPDVIALAAETPEPPQAASIEVTPAAHPAVPIEEPALKIEENK